MDILSTRHSRLFVGVSTNPKKELDSADTSSLNSSKKHHPGKNIGRPDADSVTISQEGIYLSQFEPSSPKSEDSNHLPTGGTTLDKQELAELMNLKQRDIEVRAHEQAHLAAAGQYARGGASFSYQKGPDGVSYAVAGEVGIDVSEEKTPEATIVKMQIIKKAALAPLSPSPADLSIAARAGALESQARSEVLLNNQEALLLANSDGDAGSDNAMPGGNEKILFAQPPPAHRTFHSVIDAYKRNAAH